MQYHSGSRFTGRVGPPIGPRTGPHIGLPVDYDRRYISTRTSHKAGSPTEPGMLAVLVGGGLVSMLTLFIAGFLSAVILFGEPDPNGLLAIHVDPPKEHEQEIETGSVTDKEISFISTPIISPAIASTDMAAPDSGIDMLLASPEIVAADQVRREALMTDPADPQGEVQITDDGLAETFFPPEKPSEPEGRGGGAVPSGSKTLLAASGGNYTLQLGAFKNRQNAEALVRELAGIAEAGIFEQPGSFAKILYFVRAGQFVTRADALKAVKNLRRRSGYATFVYANLKSG